MKLTDKKKMKNEIIIALALTLCLCASGCAERGPGDELIERESETEFTPTPDVDVDADLLKKYQTHKENAPLAFKSNSENPASDFEYSDVDGGLQIDKYIGEGDIVVIPDTIDGKAVVSLAASGFSGQSVRAVYIPDSVKTIKKGAFEGCTSLSTLRVPFVGDGEGDDNGGVIFGADDYVSNGLKIPGSLKMLIVGEGETEVASNSLSYFKSLEAIILPQSLQKIGQFAFNECRSLVYVDFGGTRSIEEYAFLSCESLISLEIPDSVEEISLGAFMQCDSLKYISVSFVGGSKAQNQYIGYIFGAEERAWNESFVPAALSYITVRGESVPDMAFEGCRHLIEVTLAEGVKTVGERAFSNCKSMQSVIFADSVESIGADAFANCYTLEKIEFGSSSALNTIGMQAFMNCSSLAKAILPTGIVELPAGVFTGCKSLKSVECVSVTEVNTNAFYGCSALETAKGIEESGVAQTGNSALLEILK